MLIFIDSEDKIRNIDRIDGIIRAEIPDESTNQILSKIFKQFMIHGNYGQQNLNSPCIDKNVENCTNKFPRKFIDTINT